MKIEGVRHSVEDVIGEIQPILLFGNFQETRATLEEGYESKRIIILSRIISLFKKTNFYLVSAKIPLQEFFSKLFHMLNFYNASF